jgi:hypothetical protein
MAFGAAVLPGGGTRFRLWAPSAARVALQVADACHPLQAAGDGWHELTLLRVEWRLADHRTWCLRACFGGTSTPTCRPGTAQIVYGHGAALDADGLAHFGPGAVLVTRAEP